MLVFEIRNALLAVREQLDDGYRLAAEARERIEESIAMFTELGRAHPESLLPPELGRAHEQITEARARIAAAAEAVDRYAALL
ncbi:hypothetical protein [Gandjariella thermophila]|uniref:Uncharacterized protein n=1 Tax=Gandjariella thermophila TaxID=1931992 RepID=A0A4D4J8D2_9PSEU|nr:hypothetical protein [Gandjariella thermophila]GDY30133.1 hypothetical protein GTS_17660 [Gandjariella thermophila]